MDDNLYVNEVDDQSFMGFEVTDESEYPQGYEKPKEGNHRFNFETHFVPVLQDNPQFKNYREAIYSHDLGISNLLLFKEDQKEFVESFW